jgi:hypothetical protein
MDDSVAAVLGFARSAANCMARRVRPGRSGLTRLLGRCPGLAPLARLVLLRGPGLRRERYAAPRGQWLLSAYPCLDGTEVPSPDWFREAQTAPAAAELATKAGDRDATALATRLARQIASRRAHSERG